MSEQPHDKDEPVKRYTQMGSGMVSTFHGDQSQPAGDWVKASDYDALREEVRSNITAASALRGWPYGMSLHDFCEAVTEIPAPLPELQQRGVCPDCYRFKARNADDCAAGDCSKWYAVRDKEADADCTAFKNKTGYYSLSTTGALHTPAQVADWLDNNMTHFDTVQPVAEGPNVPVLATVSKRIWYHATDDQKSWPFSALVDRALSATQPLTK